jgi:hypothetical protein
MRPVTVIGLTVVIASALAVHTLGQADSARKAPTGDEIVQTCGSRIAKMFSRFGLPENLTAERGSKPEFDKVIVIYGPFGFSTRDKTVRACLFYSGYTGVVRGVHIGDTRAQVEQALGREHKVEKSSIDVDDYGYALKDLDAVFWTDFDKDGKVRLIEVQLN